VVDFHVIFRHGRACPGHPRGSACVRPKNGRPSRRRRCDWRAVFRDFGRREEISNPQRSARRHSGYFGLLVNHGRVEWRRGRRSRGRGPSRRRIRFRARRRGRRGRGHKATRRTRHRRRSRDEAQGDATFQWIGRARDRLFRRGVEGRARCHPDTDRGASKAWFRCDLLLGRRRSPGVRLQRHTSHRGQRRVSEIAFRRDLWRSMNAGLSVSSCTGTIRASRADFPRTIPGMPGSIPGSVQGGHDARWWNHWIQLFFSVRYTKGLANKRKTIALCPTIDCEWVLSPME
jgi:hypothetical protein